MCLTRTSLIRSRAGLLALLALCGATAWTWAGDPCPLTCRLQPVMKPIKKTIYCLKRVPYCPHGTPCPLDGDGCCPRCAARPRYKSVLMKKEVIIGEECVMECVPVQGPACIESHAAVPFAKVSAPPTFKSVPIE